jgi:hypothetical protein
MRGLSGNPRATRSAVAGSAATCEHLGAFADAIRAEGTYKPGDTPGMFDFSVGQLKSLRETGFHREYRLRFIARERQASGLFRSYSLSADPLEREMTGFSSFWMSELGEIRLSRNTVAGPSDDVLHTLSRRRPTTR